MPLSPMEGNKVTAELTEEVQLSPRSSQLFQTSMQQFVYQSPNPSPLKRKSPASGLASPPPNKRITRSSSAASLRSAAVAKQPIFPPPVQLSPSPRRLAGGGRSVSSPTPTKTPPARPRTSPKKSPASPSPQVNLLTDALAPNLHIMFVGLNPGIQTATTGFAYAHPSNLFYPLLHISGLTSQYCRPSEYRSLVDRYGLGNTNIVTRPTKDGSMLSRAEMEAGVSVIEEKVKKYKPGCVCLVGKSIWDTVERVWKREGRLRGGTKKKFEYGWQDMWMGKDKEWEGARVFAATSTSGRAITLSYDEKVEIWKQLGEWYKKRLDVSRNDA